MHASPTIRVSQALNPLPRPVKPVFSRHKKALAQVASLRLTAGARFLLSTLLSFADADGVCWPQIRELARIIPRSGRREAYSEDHVMTAARQLRTAGLVTWERILPGGRYPSGIRTQSGGRQWQIDLAKLCGDEAGTSRASRNDRSIVHDRSRSIVHDRSSDLSSPSEKKSDPARGERSAPARPAAATTASETPSVDAATEADPRAAAPARDAASETPSAAPVPSAAAARPPSAPHRERQRTNEEQNLGQTQAAAPAVPSHVYADLARIFGLARAGNGPPALASIPDRPTGPERPEDA
jgi:hypothetical protein